MSTSASFSVCRPALTAQGRIKLDELLKKKFFYAPAFSIYGGVAGLYDFGPPGCALQANFIDLWRRHFIFEEEMLEVDTTILTPFEVLKASGHVDRFSDWMTKDAVTGDVYRADHLLKAWIKKQILGAEGSTDESINLANADLAKLDGFSPAELQDKFRHYQVVSDLGNPLTPLMPFNLMFGTEIGPSGLLKGFLRPETAQGQFVNFKRLLEANYDRMPFASAQIGKSFRNEISPRSGLLRVREFLMAEIEHYVHPAEKNQHPKFESVSCQMLPLLSRQMQANGSEETCMMCIGEAVHAKIIDNATLGYFLVRIYLFLLKIGIHQQMIRFRQHQKNEMAHYASDCWDAELLTSYGWVECVGCADRAAYDLTVHSQKTKEKLVVRERLLSPSTEEKIIATIDRKAIGISFKNLASPICAAITTAMDDQQKMQQLLSEANETGFVSLLLPTECTNDEPMGKMVQVPASMVNIHTESVTSHVREFTPSVIEPSFGIGRIIYALLEHSYWTRVNDEQRAVLSLCPLMAPTKVVVVPLLSQTSFESLVSQIAMQLKKEEIVTLIDNSSATVGRKYARADELGTPFAVTVDHRSVNEYHSCPDLATVTLRDRDSTSQIRVRISELPSLTRDLIYGRRSWDEHLISLFEKVTVNN